MTGFGRPKIFLFSFLAVVIAAAAWFFHAPPAPPADDNVSTSHPPANAAAVENTPPPRHRHLFTKSKLAHEQNRPHLAGKEVSPAQRKAAENDPQLQVAASSVRNYRVAFNQNPVGNNADITRILLGKNVRGINYLPADVRLNEKGELLDRWDQPLFFHQLSATVMEVRSAGPDHIMWNSDDEVLR